MHPLIQLALRAMTALTVAYHTIWACAPAVHLPPPTPMAKEQGLVVGGSLVGGAWEVNQQASLERVTPFVSGQAFGMVALSDRWNVGGTAFLGMSTLLGAGAFARLDVVEANRFYLGAQAGGGLFYGSIGVPVGVGVTDSLWLYSHPNVTTASVSASNYYTSLLQPQLPLGLWWQATDTFGLGVEVGSSAGPDYDDGVSFAPYAALSVSTSL
jgi:hypothetical protein